MTANDQQDAYFETDQGGLIRIEAIIAVSEISQVFCMAGNLEKRTSTVVDLDGQTEEIEYGFQPMTSKDKFAVYLDGGAVYVISGGDVVSQRERLISRWRRT